MQIVSDNGAGALLGVEQFVDGNTSGSDYGYDDSGNLTVDLNKGIVSIAYSHLNKPTLVTFSNSDKIAYIYDAAGTKLRQTVCENSTAVTKQSDYIGPFHYEDSDGDATVAKLELQFFSHEEGRVRRAGNDLVYETFLKDHLGNTRVMFADLDENGWIDPAAGGGEVVQIDHYYPFGMRMSGTSPALATAAMPNAYTYNGKEYQDELNLGWHDYGARMYDASVGRWNGVDALSEKYYSQSTFHFSGNNPIRFVDANGMNYGDYYSRSGRYLGSDGIVDNRVYAVDDNAIFNTPDESQQVQFSQSGISELDMTHSEFLDIVGTVYGEADRSKFSFGEAAGIYDVMENRATIHSDRTGTQVSVHDVASSKIESEGIYGWSNRAIINEPIVSQSKQLKQKLETVRAGVITASTTDNSIADYSGGATSWHGRDFSIKAAGAYQVSYARGFNFTDSSHDIYNMGSNALKGNVTYTYESTAAHGRTTFMRTTPEWRKANFPGGIQGQSLIKWR